MILQVGADEKSSALDFAVVRNTLWIGGNAPFFEVLLDPIAKGLNYRRIFCCIRLLGRPITSGYGKSAEVQTLNSARASDG
jgi:hypothetical protein